MRSNIIDVPNYRLFILPSIFEFNSGDHPKNFWVEGPIFTFSGPEN